MSNERIDLTQFEESFGGLLDAVLDGTCTLEDGEGHLHDRMQVILAELKRCYERIDYLESVAEEYRQERPEEYCANCYAYLDDYDGDGVKYCLCSDCDASE